MKITNTLRFITAIIMAIMGVLNSLAGEQELGLLYLILGVVLGDGIE